MPHVLFSNTKKSGEVPEFCTILDAAMRLGAPLDHACGGRAACGTCRVRIDEGLGGCSPLTRAERPLVSRDPRERLGCQARFLGDVTVTPLGAISPEQRGATKPPTPRIPGFLEATGQGVSPPPETEEDPETENS